MKKILSAIALASAFATGAILTAQVHDWHDLDDVHKHVVESINEMERARAANQRRSRHERVAPPLAAHKAEEIVKAPIKKDCKNNDISPHLIVKIGYGNIPTHLLGSTP